MFHLIESKEDLNFLSGELSERGCLAIDTEFKRTSKDNLQLSLIQRNNVLLSYFWIKGWVAEWLCRGLQILVRRFDSDPSLQPLF